MRGAPSFQKGSRAYQFYCRAFWVAGGATFLVLAGLAASRGHFGENRQGQIDFSAAHEPVRFWSAVVFMALAGLMSIVIGITMGRNDKPAPMPQRRADSTGHNH